MDFESLKVKSAEALIGLIDGVKETKDFVLAQIPDILHQLVVYNMVRSGTLVVLGLIAAGFGCWKLHCCTKTLRKPSTEANEGLLFLLSLIQAPVFFFISYRLLSANFFEFIELLLAPKVWLIEYGIHLAKELKS